MSFTKFPHSHVEVWVPHRISGFFQMMDPNDPNRPDDPLKIGSRGGGPSLNAFGKTRVSLSPYISEKDVGRKLSTSFNFKIIINSQDRTEAALTTITVLKEIAPLLEKKITTAKIVLDEDDDPVIISINHQFDLPMGSGYGSSGAGALGVAYALNYLFDLGLSDLEASKYAHIAEVANHTGLGTVGGQFVGGLSISKNPGFPFDMAQIPLDADPNLKIVVGSYGMISTKKILTDPKYKNLIYKMGKIGMVKICKDPTVQTFSNVCQEFLENTEMLQRLKLDHLQDLIDDLYSLKRTLENSEKLIEMSEPSPIIYGASMNQLGQSIFCICNDAAVDQVVKVFEKHNPTKVLKVLEIFPNGPEIKK